ncbi:MAG TPA: signal recognition particle-docking protein FtsY, partial [Halothiobacillaceae bacterium]|nr:signal recognition particle-docking protein FtsY [Halothiobacillaceae bacterium]
AQAKLVAERPGSVTSRYDQSLREPLKRTRRGITRGLGELFLGRKKIDDELLEEIETRLLMADVGQNTTMDLIDELTDQVERKRINDPEHLFETLWQLMVERLERVQSNAPLIPTPQDRSHVIVVCGINGSGKTTSIGKLAHRYKAAGRSVLLGAADTFRAAAVEQLISWGERNQIRVIGEPGRGDPASVAFDAVNAANARNIDICVIDTAGRLHTQSGLMDELTKLVRVVKKADAKAPDEVLLVIDASIGQNALVQAREFHKAITLTGLIVTKLDGTAKGGIVFAIADELGLPIRFIGVGERSEDLRPFEPEPFVNALLDRQ